MRIPYTVADRAVTVWTLENGAFLETDKNVVYNVSFLDQLSLICCAGCSAARIYKKMYR